MKTTMRNRYGSITSLLALGSLIAACGYAPGEGAREDRRAAIEKLRATADSLPKPGDLKLAKYPGMDRDEIRYHGNYRGRTAFLEARYLTNVSPDEACQTYLRFVETQPQWTHTQPPCGAGVEPLRVIDVVERFPGTNQIRFWMTLVMRPPEARAARDTGGSEIRLKMYSAIDGPAAAACAPAGETARPLPCAEADWNGLDNRN
jgi:hypothetical protein